MSANDPRGATRLEPPSPTEELYIIRKLGLSPAFFCGAITPAARGERLRAVIAEKRVARIPVWRGRDETWEECADRWYGPAPISTTDQPHTETVSP